MGPPVFLSHFWIALDQATYDALQTSSQVAALGAVKEQKVVAGSESWSACERMSLRVFEKV
jgi:hypothetical protein